MVRDVDDPSGIADRAQNQLDLARDLEDDRDAEALVHWGRTMLMNDKSPATVSNRVNPMHNRRAR